MKVVITGIGTDVGKTLVSALLVQLLKADYWKPVQTGGEGVDEREIKKLVADCHLHPSSYTFKAPLSPDAAAERENVRIDETLITLPCTENSLIIEGAGGVLVPLNEKTLFIDLFSSWNFPVILVSRTYLGSINHTLLSIEALRARSLTILGVIFNGEENKESERSITSHGKIPVIGRVPFQKEISRMSVNILAEEWRGGNALTFF